jgi:hypothetical protein
MAAPAELSSGSAPESVAPEPVTVESADPRPDPTAPQPRVPEQAEAEPDPTLVAAEPDQLVAAEPDPELVTAHLTGAEQDEYAPAEQDEYAPAEQDEYAPAEQDEYAPAEQDEYAPAEQDEGGGRGRGVGWLVTAAIAVVVIGLAAAVGALAVTTHGFRSKTVVTYRPAAVFRLRAGDCINSSQNGLSVTILSCASPHDAEVFATFSLTGSSWPGSAAIAQQASSGCGDRMASYVNPALADAGLTQEYVYPDRQAWQAGVRTVVCEVSAATGQLTGSVRQGG